MVIWATVATLVLPSLWVELWPDVRSTVSLPPLPNRTDSLRVHVVDWGYHTAIILEQPGSWALGPPGHESARFIEYAWGDRRFYMEQDYRAHAVFATLFLPTESVTYVEGRTQLPGRGARSLHSRDVSPMEFLAIVGELESSIVRDSLGQRQSPHPATPGYAGRFYPAVGRYLWWSDCNRWTVDRLAAAGLAVGGRGVVFSGQVPRRLRGFSPALDRIGNDLVAAPVSR
jgi:hypothetical protein